VGGVHIWVIVVFTDHDHFAVRTKVILGPQADAYG
jgi:hypothetical protein